jgi:Endonuclease NucS
VADAIGLWAVSDGQLKKVAPRQVDRERRLEDWIESNPDILGERFLLVGRQVQTAYGGIIDLLALDSEGRSVIIELKRGRTPRDIVAQGIDYASWVAVLSDAEIRDRVARITGQSFSEAYQRRFGAPRSPEQLNTQQRILIVATDVDDATSRIIQHLTTRYGIDINVVALSYFNTGEQELLARTWVVGPAELAARIDAHGSEVVAEAERAWTGLWHVNVGAHSDDMIGRNWSDMRRYGFLSAGQGYKWRDEIGRLSVGDRVFAYLNGSGYVGAGIVTQGAVHAFAFTPPGFDTRLEELPLKSRGWFVNSDDMDMCEWMVAVNWLKTVDPQDGVRASHPLRGTVRKIWGADLAQTLLSAFGNS